MRLVVLGTGTGVGKTAVVLRLVSGLLSHKHPTLALKPIETGFPSTGDRRPAPGSDAAQLEAAAAFHVQHPRPHPLYALQDGVSPHLAAEREGQRIDLERVQSWLGTAEGTAGTTPVVTVIETAGGVFSPLSLSTRNFDLAVALGAEVWLLVAPDRLGVLHDVAATLAAMAQRDRAPDALVLAAPHVADASTGSNAAELRRLHPGLPVFPASLAGATAADAQLLEWILSRSP